MGTILLSLVQSGSSQSATPANRFLRIETKAMTSANLGDVHVMLISVNANDAATLPALMPSIVAAFKRERTAAPPDTRILLITVIGSVTAAEFKQVWSKETANDDAVKAFLTPMARAQVAHGSARGQLLDEASLRD